MRGVQVGGPARRLVQEQTHGGQPAAVQQVQQSRGMRVRVSLYLPQYSLFPHSNDYQQYLTVAYV